VRKSIDKRERAKNGKKNYKRICVLRSRKAVRETAEGTVQSERHTTCGRKKVYDAIPGSKNKRREKDKNSLSYA